MAYDIGPKIGIDGEAEFRKGIQQINTCMRTLATEMQAVTSQYAKNDKSVVNLSSQNKVLTKQIETQKEKLSELKKGLEESRQKYGDNSEVTQKWQQAVNKATAELNKMERQVAENNKTLEKNKITMEKVASTTEKIGKGATKAGKAMLPVTAAIGAAGATAVKAMDNVDQGLDTIMKKTGATGTEAKALESILNEVAGVIPAEFADIGAAIGEINTRLNFTGDKLKQASISFLKFAKINDTDVNSAVQLVTRAMGDAGISADNYQEVLDALTVAAQKSGISIDTLATNLAKYGAPMRALGLDTKQSIALFAGWEKAGVNTEIAFSGMKKAISNWGKAGKDSTVEFKKAIEEIKSAPSIAAATTKAIEVFGAKAGPDLADAIKGGRFEVEQYIDALNNAGGAVESTYGMVVDEVDDTQVAIQNMQVSLHDIGETIAKTVGPIMLSLSEKVKSVANWFGSLDKNTQGVILTILAAVAVIGPLLIVIGQIATGISAIIKIAGPIKAAVAGLKALTIATEGQTVAQTILSAVMKANPIFLIITAITALVAAFIYLWNNCEGFRQFWIDLWNTIKDWCINAWESIKSFFASIPEWWNNLWSSIGKFFEDCWNGIISFFTETIPAWIQSVIVWFQSLPEKIGYAVGQIIGHIIKFGVDAWNWITTELPKIILGIYEWFQQLPGKIWNWLVETVQKIAQWGMDMYLKANEAAANVFNSVINWFKELPGKLWNWLVETVQKIAQWGLDMRRKAEEGISNMVTSIVDTIKSLPEKMLEIGKNIVTGIWDGIKGAIDWIEGKIGEFTGGLVNGVKDVLGIHSPSKVFAGIGEYMAQGLGIGFAEQMASVKKQMSQAVPTSLESPQLAGIQGPDAGQNVGRGMTVSLHIDNFYNNTDRDINDLTDMITQRMQFKANRRAAALG